MNRYRRLLLGPALAFVGVLATVLWFRSTPNGAPVATVDREPVAAPSGEVTSLPVAPGIQPERVVQARAPSVEAELELRGRVVAIGAGTPLDGAIVRLSNAGAAIDEQRTGSDGLFVASALQRSDTTLSVERDGYLPFDLTHAQWCERVDRAGGGVVELELSPSGTLSVRVVDEAGDPVAGAGVRVELFDATSRGPLAPPRWWPIFEMPGSYTPASLHSDRILRAGTDAQGELEIGGLPCGRPLLAHASVAVAPVRQDFTIDAIVRRASIVLKSSTAASLEGSVLWVDGRPASGILLRIRPFPPDIDLRVTSASGKYTYRGLTPGHHVLDVEDHPAASMELELVAGSQTAPEIVLEPKAVVSGRLVMRGPQASLEPIPGEGLYLLVSQPGRPVAYRSFRFGDGSFRFEVTPGPVRLLPLCQEDPPWGEWDALEVVAPAEGVELVLGKAPARILLEPSGFEPAAARAIFHAPREERTARAASSRRRSIHPGAGEEARIVNVPEGPQDLQIVVEGAGAAWFPGLFLEPGETLTLGRVELGFGTVEGHLAVLDVERASRLPAVVLAALRGSPRRVDVDDDGSFRFSGVPAGRYFIAADVFAGRLEHGRWIDVQAGERVLVGDLAIPELSSLRCTVVRDGAPVSGARLRLASASNEKAWWQAGTLAAATSDAEGVARFDGVHVGQAVLSLMQGELEPGYQATQHIDVAPGSETSVRFELPTRRVAVRFGSSGKPLRDVEGVNVWRPAASSFAVAQANGAVRLAPWSEPTILAVQRRWPLGSQPVANVLLYHVTRVPPLAADEEEEAYVELEATELCVRVADREASLEDPVVDLLSVAGEPVAPDGAAVRLWSAIAADGSVRAPHLPAGSRVVIRARRADGRVFEREVEFRGPVQEELLAL